MSQSQVISFRVSGDFLNWIEAQKLDGESINQAAQRILKEVSGTSTDLSTVSTVSTITTKNVDRLVATSLDPVLERLAAVEERLGKLSA
ncbi:MAG: hypothetical protein EAZ78_06160 [Oscillatoriales cyanobacterium]|uniref:Uncharacterized protein n=1 Tax=Microcoleus anatoxicus PTRS2 TaxID=2705321 RepID=A0ABU8YYU1_9CYAN|nr:MAG: hypothetical protein EAZ78_06160 [Oscillatoriales cyanobacterium]TAF29112.1 MAG: hypothetical protein EAZ68_23725 [Oscillatoriales cyanobacterium]